MPAHAEQLKPSVLPLMVDGIPAELRARSQWVGFRLVLRDGRWAKVPYDFVTRRPARTNDPRTWASFGRALAWYRTGAVDGVGFVFSKKDPYAGVDLDGCRDPEGGEIAAWAAVILAELDSYAEVSPSGTGVKVIVRGGLPCVGTGGRRRMHEVVAPSGKPAEIEPYHWGRFFALTGVRVDGVPATIEPRETALSELWERFFGATQHQSSKPQAPRTPPRTIMCMSDAELLDRARTAANGDRFRQLFDNGTLDPTAATTPEPTSHSAGFSHSGHMETPPASTGSSARPRSCVTSGTNDTPPMEQRTGR